MKDGQRSICPFCAMGCSLILSPGAGGAYHGDTSNPTLDYDSEGPFNRGSLCGKGNMALELVCHPKRLDAPRLGRDGREAPVSWDEAYREVVDGLVEIRESAGPQAIGIVAGPHLSNEEAKLAAEFARALGTPNIDLCEPEDRALLTGLERSPGRPDPVQSVEQIDKMTATLVIGDLFTVAPCIAKPILNARYDRRRNLQGVLGPTVNRTAWFGKPSFLCSPGQETAALALMLSVAMEEGAGALSWTEEARAAFERIRSSDMEGISGLSADEVRAFLTTLRSERETGIFFCASFGGIERTDLAAGLAALLAEATGSRFLGMPVGANAIGVRSVLSGAGFPSPEGLTTAEMIEACATGDIKALLVLGGDPIAAYPGYVTDHAFAELDLLVVTSVMPGETTAAAHVMLPSAAWGEKDGVMSPAFEGELDLGAALIPPGAARSDRDILEALSKGLRTAQGEARPEAERAPVDRPAPTAFFDELEFHFRMERRDHGAFEAGTHMLLPRNLAAHSGDGWMTRHFTWSGHECTEARLSLSPEHAADLGVAEGDHVRIRSRESEAVMGVRLEERVPEGVVLAPPHCPEVRRLMRWQLDPVRRDVDMRPNRVSVEALSEDGHDH